VLQDNGASLATSVALMPALPQAEQRNKAPTLTDLANVDMTLSGSLELRNSHSHLHFHLHLWVCQLFPESVIAICTGGGGDGALFGPCTNGLSNNKSALQVDLIAGLVSSSAQQITYTQCLPCGYVSTCGRVFARQ